MNKFIRILSCILFCFIFISAHSQEIQGDKVKLEQAIYNLQKHKSFEVRFKQEIFSSLRNKTSNSEGVIKILSPNKFYIEVQKPRLEFYMSNGSDFWKYVPDFKHAQHLDSKVFQLDYIQLLANPKALKNHYKIYFWSHEGSQNSDAVSIKLEPKEDNSKKILYATINVKKGLIEDLQIDGDNGNRIKLFFFDLVDKKIDEYIFNFNPPQGIVIDKN